METLKGFYPYFKLHKVCAKDGLRPIMGYIYFKDGNAYATDGHIAVAAPLSFISNFEPEEKELLEGKFIHASQFAQLLKMRNINVELFGEKFVFYCETKYGETVLIPLIEENKLGKYPNVESLLKQAEESIKENYNRLAFIGFRFDLLNCLKDATNTKRFEFYFSGKNCAIIVRDADATNEIRALLMPLLVENPKF